LGRCSTKGDSGTFIDEQYGVSASATERTAYSCSSRSFDDRARVAALGDADSYATRLYDYEHSGRDQVAVLDTIVERALVLCRADASQLYLLENDRFILRSITDEIMYEIMRLSGQEYVDMYATRAKELAKEPAKRPPAAGGTALKAS